MGWIIDFKINTTGIMSIDLVIDYLLHYLFNHMSTSVLVRRYTLAVS